MTEPSEDRVVIRVERPYVEGLTLHVSSAEMSGPRLIIGWEGKERKPDQDVHF